MKKYTVKLGDTIERVSFANQRSTGDFLLSNPEYTSVDNLLAVNTSVTIKPLKPSINVVVEKTKNWPNNALFVIGKWHNKRTGYSHFVLMKGPRDVEYDPLGDSVTVKEGDIESYRAFIAI